MNEPSFRLVIIFVVVLSAQLIDHSTKAIHVKIYDNIAEISRQISPYDLPIIFSEQEWSVIRPDSIRLIGNCINVRVQKLAMNDTSFNGQTIMIKRDINNDTYTHGIMIDETRNLIHDLVDDTFYTVTNDRIRYLTIPAVRKYSVNFVFEALDNEPIYVRYLQNNLKWKVRYDLLLEDNSTNSVLQAYADIHNPGSSSLTIDMAELISGDVNIEPSSLYDDDDASPMPLPAGEGGALVQADLAPSFGSTANDAHPTVLDSQELVGLYYFSINETFTLDSQSHSILPMFRPTIEIERFGSIEKYFSPMNNRGHAQRTYRLRVEDYFLPGGQVFVRESDRLVGETFWLDLASNETNEFTLGLDPDLRYAESVKLISRRRLHPSTGNRIILSTYSIQLHLSNNKQRPMDIEYRLKFASQNHLELRNNTDTNLFKVDGLCIVATLQLQSNYEHQFSFSFETRET